MPLVKAQCTGCGAALEVDEGRDAAVCPFCNTPYIIEKAINLYKISNTYHIENAIFENGDSEEKVLKRGVAQLEMKEYTDALKTFKKMTQLYPENHRGWLGLCIADSEINRGIDESEEVMKYRKNALYQCPDEEKKTLKNIFVRSDERIAAVSAELEKNEAQINEENENLKKYEQRLKYYYKCDSRNKTLRIAGLLMTILSPILTIGSLVMISKVRFFIYPAIFFAVLFIIGILLIKVFVSAGDWEDAEVRTYNEQEESRRLIEKAAERIEYLRKRLDDLNNGESESYYIELLKS